ncbi:putative tyrosyl-DNA Phosphodiesterase (Tdp1) [Trypanosoma cruzi]|uniref:Putative tyrosyl-DNA Phosphodiesterase (Tdp1) n=1 Tax=Trypanosoma cruzi TaxID=5693 RepID=A0A2V2VVC8_TRYCR|nr:putative tyrosyl-DNA Phosphodiesterase (Tdp1) [Trypanosoma cruzi]RNF13453.1 putative tyrosyl-DNA Phosphodiesterase (Tdp1) [Trypanosoma cruzi]
MNKLLCPFWVNRVDGISFDNPSALTLGDLLYCDVNDQEEVWSYVLLANYMIDIEWLVRVAPSLLQTKQQLFIVSGEKEYEKKIQSSFLFRYIKAKKIRIVEPKLPLPFGVHHSKLVLCVNANGIRVAVLTANFIQDDWAYKSQGIYVQDFPRKQNSPKTDRANLTFSAGNEIRGNNFKNELLRYLNCYGIISNTENTEAIPSTLFDEIDFSAVCVEIITSIPGYHRYTDIHSFGLGRIPKVLHSIDTELSDSIRAPLLIWQFSSQGKLTNSFLNALENAMSTEWKSIEEANKKPLRPLVQIVYPTESEVRESLEGWRGGLSLPLRLSSCHPYINGRLHRWGQGTRGLCKIEFLRRRALPHLKTYMRLNEKKDGIKWFILTSANLSRAAWGEWQKKGDQLAIRSYEFGVVYGKGSFISFLEGEPFSVTPSRKIPLPSLVEGDGLVEVHIDQGGKQNIEEDPSLFLPYDPLHLEPYASTVQMQDQRGNNCESWINTDDIPWVIDMPHFGKDVFGKEIHRAMELDGRCEHTSLEMGKKKFSRPEIRFIKRQRPD